MTRFNITLNEGVDMVRWMLRNIGGAVKATVKAIAEAIGPTCAKRVIGIRPGEKIHETMITSSDSQCTIDLGEYYAILPADGKTKEKYRQKGGMINEVTEGFEYSSGNNERFLGVDELRKLIVENVDRDFKPV